WTPIGRQYGANTKFSGVFDGQGFTIDGLYLRDDSGTEKWGLFYELHMDGTIKNLNLTNVDIKTNGFRIGGIVGYAKGLVYNVSVVGGTIEGTDTGDSQVGGIVGSIYEAGTIKNAFSNVTVKGSGRRIGGIIGSADVAGSSSDAIVIEDVYSLGPVIGTSGAARQVAGIVGYTRGTEISNAYSSSTVIGASQVGGLVGFIQQRSSTTLVPKLENSFYMGASIIAFGEYNDDRSIGRVIAEASSTNGEPTITNIWGLDTAILGATFGEFNNHDGSAATAANFADSAWFTTNMSSWNFSSDWEFKTGAVRPTLIGQDDDGAAVVNELDLMLYSVGADMGENPGEIDIEVNLSANADIYYVVVASDATAPTKAEVKAGVDYGTVTVEAAGSVMAMSELMATIADLAEGVEFTVYAYAETTTVMTEVASASSISTPGTPLWGGTDPAELGWYEIHTLLDLETYRNGVNSDEISRSSTAKLEADIDMSIEYGEGLKNWDPMGNGSFKWKGTFDGQGHKITGLYVNFPDVEGVGFFGTIEGDATIINLVLKDVDVTGAKATGALVGYGKAVITNIIVDGGTVSGTERVGGIVGRFAQDGELSVAWTNVTVVGSSKYIGGVVGHVDYTSDSTDKWVRIHDVYSLGNTTGTEHVGGIVGYLRGELQRAIAFGGVTATEANAGGVVGYLQNGSKVTPDGAHLIDAIAANAFITGVEWGVITRISDSYGDPELLNVWGLDTLLDGTRENGLDVLAANLIDATWFATNLPNWDFTGVWEIQAEST
ncbi:hypothetical protein OAO42_01980, partial [Candidatus Izimaplasma bacterium]|nr:hypothetical protein [Candidatus Izimaplasma bacterium]